MNRKRSSDRRSQDYLLIATGKDSCDCLNEGCPGCFFPCVKCRSTKCGHECRQKRKYMYEYHHIVGSDEVIRNKYQNSVT